MGDYSSTDEPTKPGYWHLVCVAQNGAVSILKNLDKATAAATYRSLKPGEHPVNFILPTEEDGYKDGYFNFSFQNHLSVYDDSLVDSVAVISPDGSKLEPWKDVEPIDRDYKTQWLECKERGLYKDGYGNRTGNPPPEPRKPEFTNPGIVREPVPQKEPEDVRALVQDFGWFGKWWGSKEK